MRCILDKIELKKCLSNDKKTEIVKILINDEDLTDILKEIEMPYAMAEGHPNLAGKYEGIAAQYIFYPSKHLLGEVNPILHYTEGKISVLDCSCGCYGCWPFEVKISIKEDRIIWSNFEQPHRSFEIWNYKDLKPFVFDRKQYENEIIKYSNGNEKDGV